MIERLVGSTLRHLVDSGRLARDEVVVVSKIGYVQASNLEMAKEREARGTPYPEMTKYEERLWHCIHPEFLRDQLQHSLDRLEVDTLDVCLLHNPEYFLSDAIRRGEGLDDARDEFYRRLGEAFAFLEDQVAEGRLGAYGVSSNTLVAPEHHEDATSLTRMLDAARQAGGDRHRFSVVQLPLNLLESGAVFERNHGPESSQTVLAFAQSQGIAVLANRPLNAFVGGTLLRLADANVEETNIDFEESLGRLADLEFTFQAEIAPRIQAAPDTLGPSDYFRLAERLRELQPALVSLAHWEQIATQIDFAVRTLVMTLDRQLEGEFAARWSEWRDAYLPELEDLLRELRSRAAERSQSWAAALATAIDPLLPPERRGESLSRKALWTVASTPGVTCALNGMRTETYVDDSLGVLGWPDLEPVQEVYKAAQSVLGRDP